MIVVSGKELACKFAFHLFHTRPGKLGLESLNEQLDIGLREHFEWHNATDLSSIFGDFDTGQNQHQQL